MRCTRVDNFRTRSIVVSRCLWTLVASYSCGETATITARRSGVLGGKLSDRCMRSSVKMHIIEIPPVSRAIDTRMRKYVSIRCHTYSLRIRPFTIENAVSLLSTPLYDYKI